MRALFFLYREALLSGFFLGVAWIHPATYFLGIVGIILLYRFVGQTSSSWQLWLGGTLAWTIKSLFVTSLIFSAYPLPWLPEIGPYQAFIVITLFWIYFSLALGLSGGVVAVVAHKLQSRFFTPILFSCLWVIGEYLGSIFFGLANYGPNGGHNFGFSFGYVGYLLAEHTLLIQFAQVAGVFGLSFIMVAGATCLYEYTHTKTTKQVGGIIIVAVLFLIVGTYPLAAKPSATRITVATIETNFTASEIRDETFRATKVAEIQQAVRVALAKDVDYILLPEGAQLFAGADAATEEALSRFRFIYQDPEVVLIDSTDALVGEDIVMRANIFDGVKKQGWSVVKSQLVPNGEYLPYVTRLFSWLLLEPSKMNELKEEIALTAKTHVSEQYPAYLPPVLFCFSGSDPLAVKRLVANRVIPFIAHPMSHAHFGETPYLVRQLDQMLRVQALWNSVPIISAGNLVRSTLYTASGRVIISPVVAAGDRWQLRLYTL